MSSIFTLPAGRRAKWLFLAGWILIVALTLGLNLPAKFSDAEKNESTSFLPGDAESTKALAVTKRLQNGEQAPTVVVFRRDGGLTAADKAKIRLDVATLNRVTKKFQNTSRFGNPRDPRSPTPYELSRDGTTALVGNNIRGTGEGSDIIDPVDAYRDAVSDPGGGLQVK